MQDAAGIKDLENGHIYLNNRMSYDFNEKITAYTSIGGIAGYNGAYVTAETGFQSCFNNLCLQTAYEYNRNFYSLGHKYLDIEDQEGSGTKVGLTYRYIIDVIR